MALENTDQITEVLREYVSTPAEDAGLGLGGLLTPDIEVDKEASFQGDGRYFVSWMVRGVHGTGVAGPRERQSIKPEQQLLGWLPTGREVSLRVFSVLRDDGAGGITVEESRFDRLELLAQIGVRAVGRPVTASIEAEYNPDEGDILIEDAATGA